MGNNIYANGLAISLQNNLLGRERILRMITSENADEALRILFEVSFGVGIDIDNPKNFELLTLKELENLNKFVNNDCPNENFKKFILTPYDYHNAGAYFRAKYFNIDPQPLLMPMGMIELSKMKDAVLNSEYGILSQNLQGVLTELGKLIQREKLDAFEIDNKIKKAMYKELLYYANGSKILKQIYNLEVTYENMLLSTRCKNENEFIQQKIEFKNENKILKVEKTDNASYIAVYGDLLKKSTDKSSLIDFEKEKNSAVLKLLKQDKYDISSYKPFMLYYYYKLNEIKNVRLIMVCKLNGLNDEIKARLLENYDG